jgi:hypothetical protein
VTCGRSFFGLRLGRFSGEALASEEGNRIPERRI